MPTRAVLSLRQAVYDMTARAVKLPDAAMERPYAWGDYDEEGLRFALLMAIHELRDLEARLGGVLRPPGQAQRILSGFMQENAALAGLLLSASNEELDRKPGADDWCLREVLRHILQAEVGFTAVCLRGLQQRRRGEEPLPMQDGDYSAFGAPPRPEGGTADVVAIVLRSRDDSVEKLAGTPDAEIDARVYFWESEPLPLRFRLIRFELHLVQHAVQAEKTMAGIGHSPSEAERLARRLWRLLGGVEAACLPGLTGPAGDLIEASADRIRTLAVALA